MCSVNERWCLHSIWSLLSICHVMKVFQVMFSSHRSQKLAQAKVSLVKFLSIHVSFSLKFLQCFPFCSRWSSSSWTTCGKMVNLMKRLSSSLCKTILLMLFLKALLKKTAYFNSNKTVQHDLFLCFLQLGYSPQMCWITICQLTCQSSLLHPANLLFTRVNVNIDNICLLFCACTQVPPALQYSNLI